jgi:hypothetical protein
MKRIYWILALGALAALACHYFLRDPWRVEQERLGARLSREISSATEVEIYSIDPDRGGGVIGKAGVLPTNDPFGRRTIVGRSLVALPAEIRSLSDSIRDGLDHASMMGPECWEPRHALRYRTPSGDTFVVVSFHCAHGFVEQGTALEWFDIPRSAEAPWDEILNAHALPVAR